MCNRLFRAIALVIVMAWGVMVTHAQYDVYGPFASGNWWQEIGYCGVGNPNEVLAVGEVDFSNLGAFDYTPPIYDEAYAQSHGWIPQTSSTTSGSGNRRQTTTLTYSFESVTVTETTFSQQPSVSADGPMTIQFHLLGKATNPAYVKTIKVWAREYDPTYEAHNTSKVVNTFSFPFDYRDPIANSNALLVFETNDIREDGNYSFTPPMALTGRQVLYITADIQNFDINDKSMLPNLPTKTEMGANFTRIAAEADAGSLQPVNLTVTNKVSVAVIQTTTITNQRGQVQGTPSTDPKTYEYTVTEQATLYPMAGVSLAQVGRNGANGSRVLIPYRQVLYAPNDFYSKYYRIPALAKAADGSLIAISDARKYHIHDVENDIDMLVRRSTDDGMTWSNPVTIAKGSGFDVENDDCGPGKGYGDAAIATLPNGDVLCTMVYGGSLAMSDENDLTQNFYTVSHDNGQSWGQLREIPMELTDSYRGCIAPGNMMVVKQGPLAGKVLACFRAYQAQNGGEVQYKNYFLLYDNLTNTWSRLQVNGNNNYGIQYDDEAHLVEVGENTFLMSVRDYFGRMFATVTYNPSTNALSATTKNTNISGCYYDSQKSEYINYVNSCNGDIMSYDAVVNNNTLTYLLQSVPKGTTRDQADLSSGRTGVRIYYTNYNANGSLTWNHSTCISDPYDDDTYRKETAQYSSLTTLSNDLVGVLFEEYPQVIRIADDRGDFLMQSVYQLFRIGDLIPGAERVDKDQLLPPVITPETATYDCNNLNDRPDPIVISHNNELDGVLVRSKIYIYAPGSTTPQIILRDFEAQSEVFNWSDLVDTHGNSIESFIENGTRIKVSAICVKDGYYDSDVASKTYLFKTPVRRIQILSRPIEGLEMPFMQVENLGTRLQGEVFTVAVGSRVVANAADKYPHQFIGFSTSGDQYVAPNQAILQVLGMEVYTPSQIMCTVPLESQVPNNYDSDGDGVNDCLTIFAWYDSHNMGVKTRVYTNYYNSDESEYRDDGPTVKHYFHSDWYPIILHAGYDFPESTPTLVMDDVLSKDGNSANGSLSYSLNPHKQGLDLRIEVMPDVRAMRYNGIVLVKNSSTGGYVSNGPAMAPSSTSKYYLLQGSDQPFATSSTVYQNATRVLGWYTYNAFGQMMPLKVDNITFDQLVPRDVASVTNGNFDVEIYVFKENTIASVADLANNANYDLKVSHSIEDKTGIITVVDDVNAPREVSAVQYVNPAGMTSNTPWQGINIVVTHYTDGTRTTHKVMK